MKAAMTLKSAIAQSKIPNILKLILFGSDESIRARLQGTEIRSRRKARSRLTPRLDDKTIAAKIKKLMVSGFDISRSFSIIDLAEAINARESQVDNYFRKRLQMDFRRWRCQIRIKKAKELLLQTPPMEIQQIALLSGFNDKANFHRKFREITGITPSKWRHTNGKPEYENS